MKPSIAALVLCLTASFASAGNFLAPEAVEALQNIRSAMASWTSVNLRVSKNGSFYDINDYNLRINLNGSRDSGNYFHISGWVDNQFLSVNANPNDSRNPTRGYWITGNGINVTVDSWGNGFRVSGSVDSKYLSLTVDRFGSGHYSIYGQSGANLNGDSWGHELTVRGSVDLAHFDKKSLAVLGVALAAVDAYPAPSR